MRRSESTRQTQGPRFRNAANAITRPVQCSSAPAFFEVSYMQRARTCSWLKLFPSEKSASSSEPSLSVSDSHRSTHLVSSLHPASSPPAEATQTRRPVCRPRHASCGSAAPNESARTLTNCARHSSRRRAGRGCAERRQKGAAGGVRRSTSEYQRSEKNPPPLVATILVFNA